MVVVGTAISLVGVGVVFSTLERLAPSIPRSRRRWRTDVAWWFFGALLGGPLVQVGAALALVPLAVALGLPLDETLLPGHGPLSRLPWFVQLPLLIAVLDGVGYLTHLAHHRSDLWKLHAVHHSSEHLDWLAAVRVHPVEELVQRAPAAIVVVLMGFDLRLAVALGPLFAFHAVLLHANVRWRFGALRYLVSTPAFHRWHHAREGAPRAGCNFGGLSPVWDLMFGTFWLPEHDPRDFGVTGPAPPERFLGQLVWPFRSRRAVS